MKIKKIMMWFFQVTENAPTQIFVVNLQTGQVSELEAETLFSQHHINAFETVDGKIILDMSPSDELSLK